MQPNPSQPEFPGKQFPPQVPPQVQSGGSTGRVFGCAAVGCGSFVLLAIAMCGVGYWGLFYSNFPLRWIEAGIEESGAVEIEGMKGNLSTGVEIEKIRFREDRDDPNWSELKGIEVKYHTVGSMLNKKGFVVEKINVDSARFLVDLDEDFEISSDLDFTEFINEVARSGNGDMDFDIQQGEIEIQQVWLKEIVLADPDNDRELRIDEVRFDGMRFVNGKLEHLGDVTVRADLLEIDSSPSEKYADLPINRKFDIRLKKEATPMLAQDLPLQIDFGYRDSKNSVASVKAFGGQIQFDPQEEGDQVSLVFADYNPADYFDATRFGIMPSAVRLSLIRDQDDQESWKLNGEDHSFRMGQTGFVLERNDGDGLEFVARGSVEGKTVTAKLAIVGQLPLLRVRLESDGPWSEQDLWAQTVFGKEFSGLDDERQQMVVRTLDAVKKSRKAKKAESEDPGPPETPESPPAGAGPDEKEPGSAGDGG